MKRTHMTLAAALLAFGVTSQASAATLTLDGGWQSTSFGNVGSAVTDDNTGDDFFSFTLASNALLKITDAFLDGDQFDVVINGIDQGLTSTPTNDGTGVGNDYDAAYASPLFSHGGYALGPGSYRVTASVTQSPYGSGGGAIELVSSAVPEPATWAMMIGGIGFAGGAMRRRARHNPALRLA